MGILLLILKIIGIILLSIIGLILFILLVVLITPVRYKISGSYKQSRPDISLCVHFWFHLVSFKAVYTKEGQSAGLRIFFIRKKMMSGHSSTPEAGDESSFDKLPEDEESKADDGGENAVQDTDDANVTEASADETAGEGSVKDTEKDEVYGAEDPEKNETAEPENEPDKEVEGEKKEEPQTPIDKIAGKVSKIIEKISGLYAKVKKKADAIRWLLEQPPTKRLIKRSIKQLKKTVRSILPRKLKGVVTLGLEDPQMMGRICNYAGIFYPSMPKGFGFYPVFGEKIIDAEGLIKGRIILGALLGHLLKIVLCRDFFRTLKNYKRFKRQWR